LPLLVRSRRLPPGSFDRDREIFDRDRERFERGDARRGSTGDVTP
jgi:hypothetical protein